MSEKKEKHLKSNAKEIKTLTELMIEHRELDRVVEIKLLVKRLNDLINPH